MTSTADLVDIAVELGLEGKITGAQIKLYASDLIAAADSKLRCQNCFVQGESLLSCYREIFVPTGQYCSLQVAMCEKREAYIKQRRIESLFSACNLGNRFKNRLFNNFTVSGENKNAYDICRNWAENYDKHCRGLFLTGSVGTGKTHLAAAITNALVAKGVSVLFAVVPDLLGEMRVAIQEKKHAQMLDTAKNIEVLVLDDMGAEKVSEWTQEQLFMLINYRYEHELPTIITSNCKYGELNNIIGTRITSRLLEMTRGIEIKGGDYRHKLQLDYANGLRNSFSN